MTAPRHKPHALLIVLPSWVGDAVMATPALRLLREHLPGALLGGLVRPGIDQLLSGSELLDEMHVGRTGGMMGPKRLAAKVRARRYDAALLLTNSFSTALAVRLAGIPERIGYDRDGRGILLTDRLRPLRRRDAEPYRRSETSPDAWAPVPACRYYFDLAAHLLAGRGIGPPGGFTMGPLELGVTGEDDLAAADLLARAGVPNEEQRRTPMALLNPGGNDPAKRWPADRFAALADYLAQKRGLRVLLSGSPDEAELIRSIATACAPQTRPIDLQRFGLTLGTLKGVVRRCRVMVTNDTGPRHIAAAFGVPVVTLFGPTDHRWTTIPFEDEARLLADPTLPEEEVANDHPERCRIERIGLGDVVNAVNGLLAAG
ncbi:MAG: glycosyltransferase family 9 protein [Phycisphaerales bacterium]|nr:glycosyltransferase family 9 protein [Phycisphaerales bacterium]